MHNKKNSRSSNSHVYGKHASLILQILECSVKLFVMDSTQQFDQENFDLDSTLIFFLVGSRNIFHNQDLHSILVI